MADVDRLGEIVHHALWPDCPRSLYPRLTEADRARYRSVAAAVVDALGLTEEWRTTGWLGPVPESLARKQAECEGSLQRRLVGDWQPAS